MVWNTCVLGQHAQALSPCKQSAQGFWCPSQVDRQSMGGLASNRHSTAQNSSFPGTIHPREHVLTSISKQAGEGAGWGRRGGGWAMNVWQAVNTAAAVCCRSDCTKPHDEVTSLACIMQVRRTVCSRPWVTAQPGWCCALCCYTCSSLLLSGPETV